MEVNQIRFKIEKFRAIKQADIILDGITVVTGENGCGKSTISKFLYYVFKTAIDYEKFASKALIDRLSKIFYFIEELEQELKRYSSILEAYNYSQNKREYFHDKKLRSLREKIFRNLKETSDFEATRNDLLALIEILDNEYKIIEALNKNAEIERPNLRNQFRRLEHTLKELLIDTKNFNENKDISTGALFEKLKVIINKYFDDFLKVIEDRPHYYFYENFMRAFNSNVIPVGFSVLEFGSSIVSNESTTISKTYSIEQTVYIDTPMALGLENTQHNYWNDLNEILQKETWTEYNIEFVNSIIKSKSLLNGYATYASDGIFSRNSFIYKREDGSEFNLLECATGVKSFAMLQMMLKNGFLNRHTLLIIDEPEVHLHPQWIVEYARMVVLLNKHIGVKFFIASHNPDMVSAIKYISESEGTDENLNYYIAEKENDSFEYIYKHLGTDIEPIFESFNIALDRINLYGTKSNEGK